MRMIVRRNELQQTIFKVFTVHLHSWQFYAITRTVISKSLYKVSPCPRNITEVSTCTELKKVSNMLGRFLTWTFKVLLNSCFCLFPHFNNVEKQWAKLPSEIYKKKKKKGEILLMLFQIPHICFNESVYVTRHFAMNMMAENSVKMTQKMSQ